MIRVLIVDDSATSRQLLSHILSADADLRVIAEAKDGGEASQMARSLHPDIIVMDIHMPVLSGLEATREIMGHTPTPIVLVSASTMVDEVDTAMSALRAGALTVLRKPLGPEAPQHAAMVRELIENVKALAEVKVVRRYQSTPAPTAATRPATAITRPISICAIATSTGGPPALQRIFSGLPPSFPLPILVVQHIAAGFVEGLSHWLGSTISLPVKLAESGESLHGGTIYLARDEFHLGVSSSGTIQLSKAPAIDGFRPSGTHLFRTIAEAYGNRALAVILTGMGHDGVDGLRLIRQRGGTILAQDESTSAVFGMPRAAIAAGLVNQVVPIDQMAQAILACVGHPILPPGTTRPVKF